MLSFLDLAMRAHQINFSIDRAVRLERTFAWS